MEPVCTRTESERRFRCHISCAMPERSIKILSFVFSETHVRSITGYNYKYFSKMYILVRVIALLFHCAPSVWRARRRSFWMKSVKFSRESQSKSSRTSDSKMEIFPWLSNIYRWRIYLWNVSYALRKTACLKHIKQRLCQRHTQPFCQSIWWQGEREPL